MLRKMNLMLFIFLLCLLVSCGQSKNNLMGTYEYDKAFLSSNNVDFLELKSQDNLSRILIVPAYQGRVMTSTAAGEKGKSFGWINYSLIESGIRDPQFNAFGGEERFWLGPEGGPFSIYFDKEKEQVFANWRVPSVIDTEEFEVREVNQQSVAFNKSTQLTNASGTVFHLDIERRITLFSTDTISFLLQLNIPSGLNMVGYQTENRITNTGENAWTKEGGLLSIWMLCMFNPSDKTTVFIPYNKDAAGIIMNDDYFGKVPGDRLVADNGVVFFKADGMYRSKIGIPPRRATELSGSYNPESRVLTVLWFNLPPEPQIYVNSNWGEQHDPYEGDVINSYNDGPLEDGSIMGPFYELETSSPGAALKPSESITHTQRVFHFQGDETKLQRIAKALFNLELLDITDVFRD